MSNQACPTRIDCPGTDSPFRNFSAEGPDPALFCVTAFFLDVPRLGECAGQFGCAVNVCSTVNRATAQVEADAAARLCVWTTFTTPGCDPEPEGIGPSMPPTDPPPPPVERVGSVVYFNGAQTCTVDCPDGLPFSYTVPAGRYSGRSPAEANAVAYSVACRQAAIHRLCLGEILTPCCADQPYFTTVVGSGSFRGVSDLWELISGALPDGLTFTPGSPSAFISGIPNAAGVYNFTVRLTLKTPGSAFDDFITKAYSILVVQITTTSLPAATSAPYSQTLTQSEGVNVQWSIVSGALPTGLTLDPDTGVISGTATVAGTFNFTVGLFSE